LLRKKPGSTDAQFAVLRETLEVKTCLLWKNPWSSSLNDSHWFKGW
jgi:hypothetical protein